MTNLVVELRLAFSSEGDAPAALPGREAVAKALRELLLPDWLEGEPYVHLVIEDHTYALVDLVPIRNGDTARVVQPESPSLEF